MKTQLAILGLFIAAGTLFTSCDKEVSTDRLANKTKVILSKYPNASAINWAKSKDNKYDVATFCLAKKVSKAAATVDTVSVWFGESENMRLVEQEISFETLPLEVQTKFTKTKSIFDKQLYSNTAFWIIDDVCKLERDGIISYKIEVEAAKTEKEVDIYYDAQGILLKEIEDLDNEEDEAPLEIPANIATWIKKNFPNGEVLDYEAEEEAGVKQHEMDIKDGLIIVEIELAENGTAFTEVREYNYPKADALPADIQTELTKAIAKQTAFAITDLDEIEMVPTKGNSVYSFEFEKGTDEAELEITKKADGTFVIGAIEIKSDK